MAARQTTEIDQKAQNHAPRTFSSPWMSLYQSLRRGGRLKSLRAQRAKRESQHQDRSLEH